MVRRVTTVHSSDYGRRRQNTGLLQLSVVKMYLCTVHVLHDDLHHIDVRKCLVVLDSRQVTDCETVRGKFTLFLALAKL